jgi:hypothetical protein
VKGRSAQNDAVFSENCGLLPELTRPFGTFAPHFKRFADETPLKPGLSPRNEAEVVR